MAIRAPLLGAAALFLVGAAGLLATFPGRDAVHTFVPLFRSESVPAPSPVSRVSDAPIPATLFPVDSSTAASEAPSPTAAVESRPAAVVQAVQATVTPEPEVHSAVVAAVASGTQPPAPPIPLHVVMVSPGDAGPGPEEVTAKDEAEHGPPVSNVSPVSVATPASKGRPISGDSKTSRAETPTAKAEHAPTDGGSKHGDDSSKSEHRASEKEKHDSESDSEHD